MRRDSLVLRDDDTASQNHFKIGEVADLVGVRPHVLRYWEQEFPGLRPKKTRGAHRHYSRANVALAKSIHALVVEQGYSIAGARKKLHDAGCSTELGSSAPLEVSSELGSLRDDLLAVRDDLSAILAILDGADADESSNRDDRSSSGGRAAASGAGHDPVSALVTRESIRRR
jgi:DNA-binding transcriptional MerR regulator